MMKGKDDKLAAEFGERLRKLREAAGLSQAQLAAKMDPAKLVQAISRYELGQQTPTLGIIYQLAKALGCKPCDLLPTVKRRKK